jgi:hypothetical protein
MPQAGKYGKDPKLPFGSNFCLCADCGEYFRSVKAFERHRRGSHRIEGDRRCTRIPDMGSLGLSLDSKGYWRLPKREWTYEG